MSESQVPRHSRLAVAALGLACLLAVLTAVGLVRLGDLRNDGRGFVLLGAVPVFAVGWLVPFAAATAALFIPDRDVRYAKWALVLLGVLLIAFVPGLIWVASRW